MAPSRNSWSFSIHLYWDFSKSWSQIQKVGVNYSKFGVNETSERGGYHTQLFKKLTRVLLTFSAEATLHQALQKRLELTVI